MSDGLACHQADLILQKAVETEFVKEDLQRLLLPYCQAHLQIRSSNNRRFAVTGSANSDRVGVKKLLSGGIQKRGNHAEVCILMSKLASIGTNKVAACHFSEEASFISEHLDPGLYSMASLFKMSNILLDKFSVHHPLLFDEPGVYYVIAGTVRVLKDKCLLQNTTMLTVDELVQARSYFSPVEPTNDGNENWRQIWREIPAKAREGTISLK